MSSDGEPALEPKADQAFAVLGHETRLAILLALWEHRRPEEHVPQTPMSFSELRKSVGMRDGSQFNYHLKPLIDRFVQQTDAGYVLRREGERVVSAILAGAYTDEVVFDAVPSDKPCEICGGQTVFECNTDLTGGYFAIRCTECEGAFGGTGFDGALSLTESLGPVGTRSRDPEEFYRALDVMVKHQILSAVEGVCPDCTGTTSVTPQVCECHHVEPGRRCESCDTIFEVRYDIVCDVCHHMIAIPSNRCLLTEPRVLVFLEEHGYDPWYDWLLIELELVQRQTVRSADPFELEMVLDATGDRLVATLDARGVVTALKSDRA